MILKKKSSYCTLLVVVLMFTLEMLAVAAWAQEKGGKTSQEETQNKKTSETRVQTKETARTSDSPDSKVAAKNPSVKKALEAAQSSTSSNLVDGNVDLIGNPIKFIDITNVDNCNVDPGDIITFQVTGDSNPNVTLAIVVDDENANITSDSNSVEIESDTGFPDNIQFFTDDGIQTLDGDDNLEVVSSNIDCGNNNNNHHRRHRHNNNNGNNQYRQYNSNNQYNSDDEDNEDTEGDASIDSEATTASGDQYDNNNGTPGASASVGPGGSRAQAGGANAGRSPDQYAPESAPRGDVVNEIPTEGPLPNTGGASVATGAMLALVLFGAVLLAIRLLMIWRERRL